MTPRLNLPFCAIKTKKILNLADLLWTPPSPNSMQSTSTRHALLGLNICCYILWSCSSNLVSQKHVYNKVLLFFIIFISVNGHGHNREEQCTHNPNMVVYRKMEVKCYLVIFAYIVLCAMWLLSVYPFYSPW